MFVAIVMMCSLEIPDDCMQFTDRRGPYVGHDNCFIRVEEMIEDLKATGDISFPVQILYKCEASKGSLT
jgi:hypothetical protein